MPGRARRPGAALADLLPAAGQGGRGLLPGPGHREELRDRRGHRLGQPLQHRHGGVFQTTLQPADVGPVDAGLDRQRLLGEQPCDPQPPDVPCHEGPRVRAPWGPARRPLIHAQWSYDSRRLLLQVPAAARGDAEAKRKL